MPDRSKVVRARSLRRRSGVSEQVFWQLVRGRRFGVKWRRQHPIAGLVVDFYCAEAKIAVELDGPIHELTREQDQERDRRLAELGVLVLRIPTADLFDPHHVKAADWIDKLTQLCAERAGEE